MLTVPLLVCAMMVLATAERAAPVFLCMCPVGWSKQNGRCFNYVSKEMEWGAAEKHCQTMNANLASAQTVEEYKFIQRVVEEQSQGANPETWIGGSDCQQENSWLWSDGKTFSLSYWCAGQPNNRDGKQSCLSMNHDDDKCWDDQECSTLRPSVCAVSM